MLMQENPTDRELDILKQETKNGTFFGNSYIAWCVPRCNQYELTFRFSACKTAQRPGFEETKSRS